MIRGQLVLIKKKQKQKKEVRNQKKVVTKRSRLFKDGVYHRVEMNGCRVLNQLGYQVGSEPFIVKEKEKKSSTVSQIS